MSEEEGNNDQPESKTFTQEQVNAFLADQKRKLSERFGDYDELKEKASKLTEIEEATKSELQKALDRAAEAEKRVAAFEQREQVAKWASEIVKGSSIPASVLRGTTREELEAHFNDLKDLAPKPKRTPVPAGKAGESGSRAAEALRMLREG